MLLLHSKKKKIMAKDNNVANSEAFYFELYCIYKDKAWNASSIKWRKCLKCYTDGQTPPLWNDVTPQKQETRSSRFCGAVCHRRPWQWYHPESKRYRSILQIYPSHALLFFDRNVSFTSSLVCPFFHRSGTILIEPVDFFFFFFPKRQVKAAQATLCMRRK